MSETALQALIFWGDGINCEQETASALKLAGFSPKIRHINDLIREELSLDDLCQQYRVLALPGGFSFGDDLGSGRVLALKIKYSLKWDLKTFASRGGLVIGVCNGYQALIHLGVFHPGVSITRNEDGKFLNRWVKVSPHGEKCVWLRGLGSIDLPIRHGEGRVVLQPEQKEEVTNKLSHQGMMCLKYVHNPNGSTEDLAGLCDSSGRIFGLMPHPEAFVRWTAHPEWTSQANRAGAPGQGLMIFENAFHAAKESR